MHSPGLVVELKDRRDFVRCLRLPHECIADEDASFRMAMTYWTSIRQGGLLPVPRAVDPVMLKPLLGNIHKVDVSDQDPQNYFFRLWGSKITLEQFGPTKGMRVIDYPSPPFREAVLQDYRDAVMSGVPAYQQVYARVNYLPYAYGRLILPLATDGRRVDQLLVCIHERPAATLSERVLGG